MSRGKESEGNVFIVPCFGMSPHFQWQPSLLGNRIIAKSRFPHTVSRIAQVYGVPLFYGANENQDYCLHVNKKTEWIYIYICIVYMNPKGNAINLHGLKVFL
jgi:hypothetical protein